MGTRGTVDNKGTVKWFNVPRGYGFITPYGGGNDVFVHITEVQYAGLEALIQGQVVEFDTEDDGDGPFAINLKANPNGSSPMKSGPDRGTVAWFSTEKGYGFITPEDGSKDVFVHISAVERAGVTFLMEGESVGFTRQIDRHGKISAEGLQISKR
jgi:CspA family cold shock protein